MLSVHKMDDLNQFLQTRRTDGRPTHLSLFHPKGKYLVCNSDLEDFWTLYNYHYTVEPLGIAEAQTSLHIPVLVDVDLKAEYRPDLDGVSFYTLEHVATLVKIYQKVLVEILQDVCPENLYCFLLEKAPYRLQRNGKEYYKNGFHLQFPNVFMSRYQQEHILLPRVRMECKKLKEGEYPSTVTPDTMIDKGYCRGSGSPWLLYGSRKEAGMEPYLLTKGFNEEGVMTEAWWELLRGFEYGERVLETRQDLEDHLPQIFSIQVEDRTSFILELKSDIHAINWDKPPVGVPKPPKKLLTAPTTQDASTIDSTHKMVEDLLDLLALERSKDRNEWIRVGWILFNTFDGSDEGYQHWIRFSKRCADKFDESVCRYEWSRMERKDLGMASLKYMAKQDNPKGYEQVMSLFMQPLIDRCLKLNGAHNDLAMILFQRYDSEFKCGSTIHKSWYQFRDHIWCKTEEGVTLRKKISAEIVDDYQEIARQYLQKHLGAEDEDESKSYKKKMNNALKMVEKLKQSPYKTNVMKEAAEVFYDAEFLQKLDANPYLIGFHNGIYDLKTHEFRDGCPNDYVSLKMAISYRRDFTMTSPEVLQVLDYFEKIFPDHDVRQYFLDISSDVFIGGNFNKIVQVWTGEGDNGKSITQSIFEQMLGPYAIKLPTALIIGKRTQSSAACPELVRAGNGCRMAVLQEPDQKDVINIGILKELSGNDTFFARGLFKEGSEITPLFKLVLICNELPNLHNSDRATWNRIRVIPFEATFSDDAPATYEEQLRDKIFPKDAQFKDKIPGMTEALAWYLLERLKTKPKQVAEPNKVTKATEHYRRKNDVYRLFSEEFVENIPDKTVQLMELYSTFKDWFRESFPNSPLSSKMELKEYFTKKWGEPVGIHQVWTGHCIRSHFEI
jgi:P4 family phage/plasmid primase-like protien